MKKIRIIICSFIIFFSSFVLASAILINDFFSKGIEDMVVEHLDTSNVAEDWLAKLNLDITNEMANKLATLQDKMVHDEKFITIVKQFSTSIVKDVLNNNPSQNENVNDEIKLLLKSYSKDIAELTKGQFGSSIKEKLVTTLLSTFDFQPIYNDAVKEVQNNIDSADLSKAQMLYSIGKVSTIWLSTLTLFLCIGIVIYLNKNDFKWAFYISIPLIVSGIILLLASFLIMFAINSSYKDVNLKINFNISIIISIVYIMLGNALLTSKKLLKK